VRIGVDIVEIIPAKQANFAKGLPTIGRTGANRWYRLDDTDRDTWIWKPISHVMEVEDA
jgi:hypothetical protein